MTYVKQRVTPRHKVYVEIDGVLHELLPVKQTFQGDTTLPNPLLHTYLAKYKPLIADELKLARHLLRKALASIDARENYRQQREQTTVPPVPRDQARREQRAAEARRRDEEYEADPTRFARAPKGYYIRRVERARGRVTCRT